MYFCIDSFLSHVNNDYAGKVKELTLLSEGLVEGAIVGCIDDVYSQGLRIGL